MPGRKPRWAAGAGEPMGGGRPAADVDGCGCDVDGAASGGAQAPELKPAGPQRSKCLSPWYGRGSSAWRGATGAEPPSAAAKATTGAGAGATAAGRLLLLAPAAAPLLLARKKFREESLEGDQPVMRSEGSTTAGTGAAAGASGSGRAPAPAAPLPNVAKGWGLAAGAAAAGFASCGSASRPSPSPPLGGEAPPPALAGRVGNVKAAAPGSACTTPHTQGQKARYWGGRRRCRPFCYHA